MAFPLNTLIIEDSPDDAALLVDQLQSAGFAPKWSRVETEAQYLAKLQEPVDVIFSDFSLPQFSTQLALKLLLQSKRDIPFIIVSGTIGEERAVESLKSGATDYLLKDRLTRLGPVVHRALREARERAERKCAEERLRIAHEELHQLFAHSPAVIYRLKLEGTSIIPVATSDNIERLLGFSKSETLHHEWWLTHLHPDDHEHAIASVAETIHFETSRTEYRIQHKDGTYRWVEDNRRLIRDASGQPAELVGAWVDITDRKRTQGVLVESERRFRELLENIDLIAMTLDKQGAVTFCNECLLTLTGFERNEVVGHNWFTLFIPETEDRVTKLFFETISNATVPSHYENPIKTKSGELRQIVWNNTMLRDGSGKIIGTASIGEDVTDRKQAEAALQESELRFRQLAENAAEVFWISTPEKDQILYVSPGYERIWGRSCESLSRSPRDWLEAIHPDDRERILQAAMDKQASGNYDVEYRILRPDGAVRWIRDRAFPVRDASGHIVRIAGVADDITARRTLEEQFLQSQKMEAVGQLAGGVAHDFNNLLTIIQCYTDFILESKNLTDNEREELSQVHTAAQMAAGLTRQLLTFSRKQLIQFKSFDLNQTIYGLGKMLRRVIGEDVQLQTDCAANIPLVVADVGMVEQVVMNLSVNARDAMPTGGRLTIETTLVTFECPSPEQPNRRPGSFIRLRVQDTGCGMSPEIMQRIFEPFFTTKGVGKGTGLGLATVYGIMKQHQGWIEVSSQPGHGTAFNVYFPVKKTTLSPEKTLLEKTTVRGTETILLVEDDISVRSLIRTILQRQGYKVLEASSGDAALQVWKTDSANIHLLLTDMIMPGSINGLDLGQKLSALKPELKVVYTSGYSDFHERLGGYVLEQNINFVQKPYHPGDLLLLIRNVLDENRQ